MTFGRRFEGNGRGICLALDRKRQKRFEYLGYLAAVTIPSVTGIGVVMAVGESRGVVIELFRMFLLVFIGALWVSIVGGWFRSSMALSAGWLAFVVIQLVALSGIDQYLRLLACCRLYKIFISARVVCLKELHCKIHFSVFLFLVIPGGNRYNEKESLEGGDGKRCFN